MTKINKSNKKDKKKKKVTQKIFLEKKGGMRLLSFIKNNTTNLLDKSIKSKQDFKIFSTIKENSEKAAYAVGGLLGGLGGGYGIGKNSTNEEKIRDLINTSSEHLQEYISSKVSGGISEVKDKFSSVSETSSQHLQDHISSQVSESTQEVKDELSRISQSNNEFLEGIKNNFLTLPSFVQVQDLITTSRETLSNSIGQKLDSMKTEQSKDMIEMRKGMQDLVTLLKDTDQPTKKPWYRWFRSSPSPVRPRNYKEALEKLKKIDEEEKRKEAEKQKQADIDKATAPISAKLKDLQDKNTKAEAEKQKQADIDKATAPISAQLKDLQDKNDKAEAEKQKQADIDKATAPLSTQLKNLQDKNDKAEEEKKRQNDIEAAIAPISTELKKKEDQLARIEAEKQKQADIEAAKASISTELKKSNDELKSLQDKVNKEDEVRNATAPLASKLESEKYQRQLLEIQSQNIIEKAKSENQHIVNLLNQDKENQIELNKYKYQIFETKLKHEKEKQMYLLAPLIGIPVIIGCLKLYKNLKKKAQKSSPRRSPTLRRSPNYKKSAKKNFDQSISSSEAQRLLKKLEDPFYKLYNPSFVDQLFSLLNKIIDNDYLFYGILGILTILFFFFNIYLSKPKKKSGLLTSCLSKFLL